METERRKWSDWQAGKNRNYYDTQEAKNLDNTFSTLQPLVVLPPPPPPRLILIEGAPGGGKSTLALHFCHKWAQGGCAYSLDRFDLVILVYLRDQAIQNATTLADILPARSLCLSEMISSQIQDFNGENHSIYPRWLG